MKTKNLLFVLVLSSLIFSACQPAATAVPAVPNATVVLPTSTPLPTNTSLPTETPKPTVTPLSEGVLFRDNFAGELQPGWEWQNETQIDGQLPMTVGCKSLGSTIHYLEKAARIICYGIRCHQAILSSLRI